MSINPTPLVSVAMTAYNAGRHIDAAIASVAAQTFTDFELLVVDDRSTDNTRQIAADWAQRDARVKLLDCPDKGRVPALNRCLTAAGGAWFAVLDADDVAYPNKFAAQLAYLAAHPDVGVLGSDNRIIDGAGQPLARPPINRPQSHADLTADMEAGIMLLHSTMIARTDIMRAIGGYRAPFRYSQDYDLYLRLAMVTQMVNLPDQLVDYRVYPEQVSTAQLVAQIQSARIAWLGHQVRQAGRADPLDQLSTLPELGTLEQLFAIPGADDMVRARIAEGILYSPQSLAGNGYRPVIDHIARNGGDRRYWRSAARLLRAGYLRQAAGMAAALLRAKVA